MAFRVYGDSLSTGYGTTVPSTNGFAYLLATAIGVTATNAAASGSQAADVGQLWSIIDVTTADTDAAVWVSGYNDVRVGYDADDYGHALAFGIAWLGIPHAKKQYLNGSGATESGSWSNGTYGTLTPRYSSSAGATITGTVRGRYVILGVVRAIGAGTGKVYLNGSYAQDFDFSLTNDTEAGKTAQGALVVLDAGINGNHEVKIEVTSGVCFWQFAAGLDGSPLNPLVLIGGCPHAASVAAYTNVAYAPFNVGTDAAVGVYISHQRAWCDLLARCGIKVMFAPIRVDSSDFQADGIHWDDRGHAGVANVLAEAVRTGVVGAKEAGVLALETRVTETRAEQLDGLAASIAANNVLGATANARLGAWSATGNNTVKGAMQALMSKTASAPSDIGGTFDSATDSTEAIAEAGGGGGGGSSGDGDVIVTSDYGSTDALQVTDPDGSGIDGARVTAYEAAAYASNPTAAPVIAQTFTGSDGRWGVTTDTSPLHLDPGDYVLVISKAGVMVDYVQTLTVEEE